VRGDDIAERLLALAVCAIGVARSLPREAWARHITLQMIRAVTSAGANYEEARRAESRDDFIHKISLAAKELGETDFWLKLCARIRPSDTFRAIHDETNQLLAILVASARTAKKTRNS
jgi:four helix bundle protein